VVAPPKLVLVQPDSKLTAACENPSKLPKIGLNSSAINKFWATDRINLANCRDSKEELHTFYVTRDAELMK
jgi:hypothetical protein